MTSPGLCTGPLWRDVRGCGLQPASFAEGGGLSRHTAHRLLCRALSRSCEGVLGDSTPAATFLDLWLQPDSSAFGLPRFPGPDLLASPPARPSVHVNLGPAPTQDTMGEDRAGGVGGPPARALGPLRFCTDPGPGSCSPWTLSCVPSVICPKRVHPCPLPVPSTCSAGLLETPPSSMIWGSLSSLYPPVPLSGPSLPPV